MALPRTGVKQVTIYLPEAVYEDLRTKAFLERTSINKLVLGAIGDLLRKSPPGRITVTPQGREDGGEQPG